MFHPRRDFGADFCLVVFTSSLGLLVLLVMFVLLFVADPLFLDPACIYRWGMMTEGECMHAIRARNAAAREHQQAVNQRRQRAGDEYEDYLRRKQTAAAFDAKLRADEELERLAAAADIPVIPAIVDEDEELAEQARYKNDVCAAIAWCGAIGIRRTWTYLYLSGQVR